MKAVELQTILQRMPEIQQWTPNQNQQAAASAAQQSEKIRKDTEKMQNSVAQTLAAQQKAIRDEENLRKRRRRLRRMRLGKRPSPFEPTQRVDIVL